MSIKSHEAIAIDLDGTLLRSDHSISSSVSKALKELSKQEVKVVLVSARHPLSVLTIANKIGLSGPMIALNGAIVIEQDKTILHQTMMGKQIVADLIEMCENTSGVIYNLYSGFDWYVPRLNHHIKHEAEIIGFQPNIVGDKLKMLEGAAKILILGNHDDTCSIFNSLHSLGEDLSISFSKPGYLEVTASTVSKTSGLKVLSEYYGLPLKDFVCVGDGNNDIPMIQACGLGVAMGNATDALKEVADLVIGTNDEDGLAHFIDKYFFR